jgi:hypothetical protein
MQMKSWPSGDTAEHCKDNLFKLLNEKETETLLCNIDIICTTLELTAGVWVDQGYGYKAQEIAQRAAHECYRLLNTCQHHKRLGRIRAKYIRCCTLADLLYRLHRGRAS